MDSVYSNFVKVSLKVSSDIIRETLERLGIGINATKTLKQSCHIIKRCDTWFIVHYKELFLLNGSVPKWVEGDLERRNKVAELLQEWDLLEIDNPNEIYSSHGENIYQFAPKIYKIGKKYRGEWNIEKQFNINNLIKKGIIDE